MCIINNKHYISLELIIINLIENCFTLFYVLYMRIILFNNDNTYNEIMSNIIYQLIIL